MALEKTAEREMIPLIFSGMTSGNSWTYKRLDTGEVVEGEYVKVLKPHITVEVPYKRGLIRMVPAIAEANALLCDIENISEDDKGKTCPANYCVIDEEGSKEGERSSKVWSGFSIE